jgi:hypothetical protein
MEWRLPASEQLATPLRTAERTQVVRNKPSSTEWRMTAARCAAALSRAHRGAATPGHTTTVRSYAKRKRKHKLERKPSHRSVERGTGSRARWQDQPSQGERRWTNGQAKRRADGKSEPCGPRPSRSELTHSAGPCPSPGTAWRIVHRSGLTKSKSYSQAVYFRGMK